MQQDQRRTLRFHVDVDAPPVAMVTAVLSHTRVVTMVMHDNSVDRQRTVVNGNLATTKSVTILNFVSVNNIVNNLKKIMSV